MTQDFATILTTLTIYAAIVVSPGPSFALVSRMAAAGEKRAAFGATLGLALGASVYAVLTMAGLAVVLSQIGWLARAVQMAGGLYLVWLGIEAWRDAGRTHLFQESPKYTSRLLPGLRRGFIMCLSNPKAIVFFAGLYAAAIPPDTSLWAKGVILGAAFLLELAWYGAVTLALSGARVRRLYQRGRAVLERGIGVVLAALGFRLILERI